MTAGSPKPVAGRHGPGRTRVVLWALFWMSRPSHLVLILFVAAIGALAAMAGGAPAQPQSLVVAALALLLVASSVHYVNEWADYETDALTTRTPYSGGSGALAATRLPRRLALFAAIVSLVLGAAVAAIAVAGGWLPPIAGLLLILGGTLGWAYSAPPAALAWRGLGEVTNSAAGGLVLPLFGYAALAGNVPMAIILAFVPFAMLDFSNLLAVMWPDRHADAVSGQEDACRSLVAGSSAPGPRVLSIGQSRSARIARRCGPASVAGRPRWTGLGAASRVGNRAIPSPGTLRSRRCWPWSASPCACSSVGQRFSSPRGPSVCGSSSSPCQTAMSPPMTMRAAEAALRCRVWRAMPATLRGRAGSDGCVLESAGWYRSADGRLVGTRGCLRPWRGRAAVVGGAARVQRA